jgi:SAM-dependent methyltransferase
VDLDTLKQLQTPLGESALAAAMDLAPDESTFLRCAGRLQKLFPAPLARAALETAFLRRRARAKFTGADRMFFVREALEQASGEVVARHRARRFAGPGSVADLCCGIGGDAIALAGRGDVVAVDRDPLRLAMAGCNLAAHGLRDRVTLVEGDALTVELPNVAGAFADPDRRPGGARVLSTRAYHPPLPDLLTRFPKDFPLGVKLASGVPLAELAGLGGEVEFLSLDGELKECVLWRGPLAGPRRRATLLPGGQTLAADVPADLPPAGAPGAWLYDPDPAVLRAGLVGDLARLLDARPLDPSIAYLTGDRLQATPFVRAYAVEAALPFQLNALRAYLRARGVGHVQVMRRGSAVEPAELERRLKLRGGEFRTVVLTRVGGRPFALVTQPTDLLR